MIPSRQSKLLEDNIQKLNKTTKNDLFKRLKMNFFLKLSEKFFEESKNKLKSVEIYLKHIKKNLKKKLGFWSQNKSIKK